MERVIASIDKIPYKTLLKSDGNELTSDESISNGGSGKAFTPKQLLASSLAACTSMTLRMYADRKEWNLEKVEVEVRLELTEMGTEFKTDIRLSGTLDNEQKEKLLAIANKCPVHKILSHTIRITTSLT